MVDGSTVSGQRLESRWTGTALVLQVASVWTGTALVTRVIDAVRKIGTVTADFTTTLGPFADWSSPSITVVDGRARVPADTSYAALNTPPVHSLLESYFGAEVYPPDGTGAGTAWAQLIFDSASSPAGTRLRIEVFPLTNTISFGVDVGYYDPDAVVLPYTAAMRWLRLAESGGTVLFQTSGDGRVWTTRREAPTPAWAVTATDCRGSIGAFKDAGAAAYLEADNVNVVPAGGAGAYTAAYPAGY